MELIFFLLKSHNLEVVCPQSSHPVYDIEYIFLDGEDGGDGGELGVWGEESERWRR